MSETYNIYCDESCHLENDRQRVMVLGAVWCSARCASEISVRLRELKMRHAVLAPHELQRPRASQFEVKWTKVSGARVELYRDWIDYFFDDDDLHFRGVVIDKEVLNHELHAQSHDEWYYKMLFTLLEPVIDPAQHYRVYLDIKDTRSERRRAKLERVLRGKNYDFEGRVVDRVQQMRSFESELLQLTDLLIGAVGYYHRRRLGVLPVVGSKLNYAKVSIIDRIRQRSRKSLERSTWLRESKFNLLCWRPTGETP